MRDVYCQTLLGLARKDPRIMILDADLMRSHGTMPFKKEFPQRAIDVGVAEANMVGVAAGLSNMGKIPFASTFACFASRRVFDQFFISGNYAHLNVKLVGSDPGVTAGFNGGTHMPFEDIGMMRMIPGLSIVEPSDPVSLKAILETVAATYGCCYLRLYRRDVEPLYKPDEQFQLGKSKVLKDGKDVTIISLGALLAPEALKAAKALAQEDIDAAVIDALSVKPLDEDLILSYAQKTGRIVTAENHQVAGGVGAAVANLLATEHPTPMAMVGVHDEFGQVGTMSWLQQYYKLTADEITKQAIKLVRSTK